MMVMALSRFIALTLASPVKARKETVLRDTP
jgi:hypothetical protein